MMATDDEAVAKVAAIAKVYDAIYPLTIEYVAEDGSVVEIVSVDGPGRVKLRSDPCTSDVRVVLANGDVVEVIAAPVAAPEKTPHTIPGIPGEF